MKNSYVYNCNEKNYTPLVSKIEYKYDNDLDKLKVAKKLMNKQQYHHYLIHTLQGRALDYISRNGMDSTITLKVSDIDDFLRSVLWLSQHIEREVNFEYVESKRELFIESLIEKLY